MNTKDREMLTEVWISETNRAEDAIQEAVKRSQDHAYQLGLERGKQNINKTLIALEVTLKAIDDLMVGNGTQREQVDQLTEAYEQLESLHKELQCSI